MFDSYEQFRADSGWEFGYELLGIRPGDDFNACDLILDRHCQAPAKTALISRTYQGERHEFSFEDMREGAARVASVLEAMGVQRGDRVFVLLEPLPQLFDAIMGTIRLGAIAGPIFAAFGAEAIRDRLQDSGARVLITAAHHLPKVREALQDLPTVEQVLVLGSATLQAGERSLSQLLEGASAEFQPYATAADDPMLLHYSSGTTGKPKGILHAHRAIVGHAITTKVVLDLRPDDIYWCTADPGWVTGTSYGIFGPWANHVTQVAYLGGFMAEKWYEVIEQERVTVWYTSPTALRLLMREGVAVARQRDLSSLRHICSVGEPLNPEVIRWAYEVFGLMVHDTWWQTETGCIQISNYPFMPIKPGSMGRPFAGTEAAVLDCERLEPLRPNQEGLLALRPGWPSMFKTYWANPDAYEAKFRNGWYLTGDRAYMDEEGYFWFVARDDDVINTSGHLLGPFELESVLLQHPAIVEAAAFGVPAEDAGEVAIAYVVLRRDQETGKELLRELRTLIRRQVGSHAVPREIVVTDHLPRTRSGKIMRRVIRARHLGLPTGDLSALEE